MHGDTAEWSLTDHLLAAVVDHLAVSNWMFQCVNTGEDDEQPEYPKPVPRPGNDDEDEDDGDSEADGSTESMGEAISPSTLARFFG
ncbi:hypothetical protein ACFY7C_30095 [Streptomyces sp. NPDC012769]|uniref:hypothetical protein n=1 Tax=Streptomyces sp. NPDC012769 TaxID=3364848 RepID=UPI0036A335A8